MTSLHELQRRFADVLTGTNPAAIDSLVVGRGIPAAERAGIYRNNVRATFRGTMSVGFPATERLVGADYFRALVHDYQRAHPSRNGNLQHVGAEFQRFVAARFDGSKYSYLADVVAVEWAYQEILVAPEHAPLDLERLGAVAPGDYAGLSFELHPASRLLASPFPLAAIWRANREATLDESPIDLGAGADRLLLLRKGLDVEILHLAPADFAFLASLDAGRTIVDSLAAAVDAEPGAAAAALLTTYARLGVIVDFRADLAKAQLGLASTQPERSGLANRPLGLAAEVSPCGSAMANDRGH